jgi:hypothetical protein
MVSQTQQVYRYRVNEADVIEFVDGWWLAFAKENNADGLTESSVVGRVIWDFIADEATRKLYREIHDYVRSSANPILVPFRCDSPTLQRFMQLKISKQATGQLLYESKLLRVVRQKRLALLDPKEDRSENSLTMCSFCKRSLIGASSWLELENISLKLRMYDQQKVPELKYTVCPDCSSQMQGNGTAEESSTC